MDIMHNKHDWAEDRAYASTHGSVTPVEQKRIEALFNRTLPVNADGSPNLVPPPGEKPYVIAIGNAYCEHCHALMKATNFPERTPDGRLILYIDRADKNGPANRYFNALGLTGDSGLGHDYGGWEGAVNTAIGKPFGGTTFGDGTPVPKLTFPFLISATASGKMGYVLSAGALNAIDLFADMKKDALAAAQAQAKAAVPTPPTGDVPANPVTYKPQAHPALSQVK